MKRVGRERADRRQTNTHGCLRPLTPRMGSPAARVTPTGAAWRAVVLGLTGPLPRILNSRSKAKGKGKGKGKAKARRIAEPAHAEELAACLPPDPDLLALADSIAKDDVKLLAALAALRRCNYESTPSEEALREMELFVKTVARRKAPRDILQLALQAPDSSLLHARALRHLSTIGGPPAQIITWRNKPQRDARVLQVQCPDELCALSVDGDRCFACTGTNVHILTAHHGTLCGVLPMATAALCMDVSSAGKLIAVGCEDGSVSLFSTVTYRLVDEAVGACADYVRSVHFLCNGKQVRTSTVTRARANAAPRSRLAPHVMPDWARPRRRSSSSAPTTALCSSALRRTSDFRRWPTRRARTPTTSARVGSRRAAR